MLCYNLVDMLLDTPTASGPGIRKTALGSPPKNEVPDDAVPTAKLHKRWQELLEARRWSWWLLVQERGFIWWVLVKGLGVELGTHSDHLATYSELSMCVC